MPFSCLIGVMVMVSVLVMFGESIKVHIDRVQANLDGKTMIVVRMVEMDIRIDLAEIN